MINHQNLQNIKFLKKHISKTSTSKLPQKSLSLNPTIPNSHTKFSIKKAINFPENLSSPKKYYKIQVKFSNKISNQYKF